MKNITEVTDQQVQNTIWSHGHDYGYEWDGVEPHPVLTIDLEDEDEGRHMAHQIGIGDERMVTEPWGEMTRCIWPNVRVVDPVLSLPPT